MCCNGTLFANAKAEPDEAERLAAAGLKVEQYRGRPVFVLPCPKLEGTRCTIYESRFTICRSFRCQLLQDYVSDRVGIDDALQSIASAKALAAKVADDDPAAASVPARRALVRAGWKAIEDPQARERAARAYVNAAALELLLSRKFRKKPEA